MPTRAHPQRIIRMAVYEPRIKYFRATIRDGSGAVLACNPSGVSLGCTRAGASMRVTAGDRVMTPCGPGTVHKREMSAGYLSNRWAVELDDIASMSELQQATQKKYGGLFFMSGSLMPLSEPEQVQVAFNVR